MFLRLLVATVLIFKTNFAQTIAPGRIPDIHPTVSRVVDSLKLVVVVSRHGNRASYFDFKNNPYPIANELYWPYGKKQLTNYGRVQMHALGQKVRQMYGGYLSDVYKTENVHATSTAVDRTLMSGQCFLAGLFPPKDWQIWNKDMLWQPAVLYSDSPDNTNTRWDCPKMKKMLDISIEKYVSRHTENTSYVYDFINEINNSNSGDFTTSFYLWDLLQCQEAEGYKLPEWSGRVYPVPLQNLMEEYHSMAFAESPEILRLLMGPLFSDILDDMKSKAAGQQATKKMLYYSGHDITLIALQGILGGTPASPVQHKTPSTGSAVIIELHQDKSKNQTTVQVLYVDGSTNKLLVSPLKTPACGDPCHLHKLVEVTKPYTNVSYESECQL